MEIEEDWSLVALAQTGSMDAFAEIYSHHAKKIFVFILTRVRDPYLAEDFTSETFCRALKKIDSVTYEGTGVGSWLTIIARNLILDHVKSSAYKREMTTFAPPDVCDDHDDPEQAALKILTAIEAKHRVEQLLAQLRPSWRRCLELRFLQGLTHAETADAMGGNESTSKTRQRRALKELAAIEGAV